MRSETIEFIRKRKEKREAWLSEVRAWQMQQYMIEIRRVNAIARHERSILRERWGSVL